MYEKRYSNMADSERVKLESDVEDSYDIYPHPTVRVVRPNVRVIGHSSWKEALTEVTRRKAFLGFLALLVLILLLAIVIVLMVQGRKEEPKEPEFSYGFHSFPSVPPGQVIRFLPDEYDSYRPWMDQLEDVLQRYSPVRYADDKYMQCHGTSRQPGKQCIMNIYDMGAKCSHGHDFGFSSGKPCILLQLALPFHPGMVEKDGPTWKTLYKELGTQWNPNYISVTCDGKTKEDKDNLRMATNESMSVFNPVTGFPLAFFPSDIEDEDYLPPLIMVQFQSLKIHHEIAVECIAWAQNKFGKLPQDEKMYRTEFKLKVD